MNNHDKKRMKKALRSLQRAKAEMGTVLLYLKAGENPDPITLVDMVDVEAHIDIAIQRLEAKVNPT